ncbi:uncharacterized protein LOC120342983 isoform X2 [Styela clava]
MRPDDNGLENSPASIPSFTQSYTVSFQASQCFNADNAQNRDQAMLQSRPWKIIGTGGRNSYATSYGICNFPLIIVWTRTYRN